MEEKYEKQFNDLIKMDSKNNTGDNNSGYWNSGNRNSGYNNSGDRNSGDKNSGNRNSGDKNSGYWNSGDWNSGFSNSGNWNSGDRNSGNRNSGDWNSGNINSGYFNTDEPKVRIFGKETDIKREDIDFPSYLYFDLTEWVSYNYMSDKEKEENPFAEYTQGYLKQYEYKESFKKSFENTDLEDIKKTLELPNFDYDIFEEISGISKADFDRRLSNTIEEESVEEIIKLNGKKYKLIE